VKKTTGKEGLAPSLPARYPVPIHPHDRPSRPHHRASRDRYSIVCQLASLWVISNGPVFGLISIRYLPVNFFGTRHEYAQVPPHP
jgi:hypothetical protein